MDSKPTMPNPEYAWAEYLHCMEGMPEEYSLPISKPVVASPIWGILLCLALGISSMWLAALNVWPFQINARPTFDPVMIAIVLGMILGNLWAVPKSFSPGVKFSVKKILPLGIIFLGARLNYLDILRLGISGVAMSLGEIVLALILMYLLT